MTEALPISSSSFAKKASPTASANLALPRASIKTLSSPHGAPPLVLVVDDQERNLQMVKKMLTNDGYRVITTLSGEKAIEAIGSHWPDLILLDVVMPDMDGFEVCEQIKNNPATQNIPIIFLSGDTGHQSIMKGFAKGGVDYISKPFNKSELLARVRTHVELHRSQVRHIKQMQERRHTLDLIAHEWHKPLQRLSMFMSAIHADMREAERPDSMQALGREAMKETERMIVSIEGFLKEQSAQSEALHESLAPWGITTDDLKSMVGKWYVTAKRKLVDLALSAPEPPLPVVGLSFAINQIVDAVLSNAVNFTPQSGHIEVRITQEEDRIVLHVIDDGPGFSEEYLRRQFQPFMQQKAGSSQPSLGVGLASAKRIADRIHATLMIGNHSRTSGGHVKVSFPSRNMDLPPIT
ncbi:Histidine kinase-, DNA gyrase B-, and HSP90-like ATPase [Prosthecobacter debontii]|uniref:Histidine kinase-, DNA gyrase B-, and HSP90-like ATPase n=1 Tax=Prosthecobacter debontii TaxID=48467 RepID=A0A1T4WZB8_9BACT|nr:response regulator [Prosthecobacter debontii]SKA82218.1 Histidine kinase-, DNA gyrase B-, and HSP90-like ATPase [Prosthecobacter debontii]